MPTYLHIQNEAQSARRNETAGRYELVSMDYELMREVNHKGEITSELLGGKVRVVIAGMGDDTLHRWLCGSPMQQDGYVTEVEEGKSVNRVLDFCQAKICSCKVQYDSFSKRGLSTAPVKRHLQCRLK